MFTPNEYGLFSMPTLEQIHQGMAKLAQVFAEG